VVHIDHAMGQEPITIMERNPPSSNISQSAVTLHRVAAFCFAAAQVGRCAGAGGAGQIATRFTRAHPFTSASELIKQEIYFAMQTLAYEPA
jgi:hypothetical protein